MYCLTVSMNFFVLFTDGLLILSRDLGSHYKHLEVLLQRIWNDKKYASPNKCDCLKE